MKKTALEIAIKLNTPNEKSNSVFDLIPNAINILSKLNPICCNGLFFQISTADFLYKSFDC